MRDIVLPETKPALEWVNGRVLQKVSPQRKHALAQMEFAAALGAWARKKGSGTVGTEWEFRLAPPGERRRPLVPDAAYLSYARLPYEEQVTSDIPHIAPDAVVEVLSQSDRAKDIEEKVRVYLACGTSVIFLVDTQGKTVTICDGGDRRVFTCNTVVRHRMLPGFAIPARTLFEPPQPKRG